MNSCTLGIMLRDIDSLDIKLLLLNGGILGILAKSLSDTFNNYMLSWLSSTAATLAFSALVTLVVVQWTLRSENFSIYGRPACIQIGQSICQLSWLACMIQYGNEFTIQPMAITFNNGMGDQELHSEVPEQMDLLHEYLSKRLNETLPERRSLSKAEAGAIRVFCRNASDWWPGIEHLVEIARSHVRLAGTVQQIDSYKNNMKTMMYLLQELPDGKTDERGVIGHIGFVIWYNRDLYEALLVETGVKQSAKFYMGDEIKKAKEMARRN